jgi:hypothetical protein
VSRRRRAATSHPLIAAAVAELPALGSQFTAEQRAAWVSMFDLALKVAYPGDDPAPAREAQR